MRTLWHAFMFRWLAMPLDEKLFATLWAGVMIGLAVSALLVLAAR